MGIPARGARNNAVYNATLYYKKSDPDNIRDKVLEFNAKVLAYPLDTDEVVKTYRSAIEIYASQENTESLLRTNRSRSPVLVISAKSTLIHHTGNSMWMGNPSFVPPRLLSIGGYLGSWYSRLRSALHRISRRGSGTLS